MGVLLPCTVPHDCKIFSTWHVELHFYKVLLWLPPVEAPTAGVIVHEIALPMFGTHAAASGLAADWCFLDVAFLSNCIPGWHRK